MPEERNILPHRSIYTHHTNPLKVFMREVKTPEGKKGIETADELINLYLFHSKYQSKEFKENCSKEWSDE